jgi:DNA-binding sugar fermentation-stimulating protein
MALHVECSSIKSAKFCPQNEFIIYMQNLLRKCTTAHCEVSGSLDGLLHNGARYHYQLYVQKQIHARHVLLSLVIDNKAMCVFLKTQSRVSRAATLAVVIVLF